MDSLNISKLIKESNNGLVDFSDSDISTNINNRSPTVMSTGLGAELGAGLGLDSLTGSLVDIDSLDSPDLPIRNPIDPVNSVSSSDINSVKENQVLSPVQQRPMRQMKPMQLLQSRPMQSMQQRPMQSMQQRPIQQRPMQQRPMQVQQRGAGNSVQNSRINDLVRNPLRNTSSGNRLKPIQENGPISSQQLSGPQINLTNQQQTSHQLQQLQQQTTAQLAEDQDQDQDQGGVISNSNISTDITNPIEIPDHMTSLMGYAIPTTTMYFIFVLLIMAIGLYYWTSPQVEKSDKKKQKKKDDDDEESNDE
jgi:hypothetical protein